MYEYRFNFGSERKLWYLSVCKGSNKLSVHAFDKFDALINFITMFETSVRALDSE